MSAGQRIISCGCDSAEPLLIADRGLSTVDKMVPQASDQASTPDGASRVGVMADEG